MPTQDELMALLKPQTDALSAKNLNIFPPDVGQEAQRPTSDLFKQFLLKSILQGPAALRYPINSYNHNPAVMPSHDHLANQSVRAANPIPATAEQLRALFPQANLNTRQVP